MINQQFVRNELSQYTYVNREDDLGEEGLRRAKESYRPGNDVRAVRRFGKAMSAPQISYAAPEDRAALMRLWKRVFGRSRTTISPSSLHTCFVPGQTLVARTSHHAEPAAMLFLLPIVLRSGAARWEGRYIYAVATDPDFRSRGLSSLLLSEVHRRLAVEGLAFSALVPAESSLFDYYGVRGFSTEFFRRAVSIVPGFGTGLEPRFPRLHCRSFFPCGTGPLAPAPFTAAGTNQALAYQQRETRLLGGETLSFSFEGESGYAVCHPAGELVLIKEWGFSSLCEPVFAAIARRFGRKTLRLDLPALRDEEGARPFAMTRWYLKERKREDGTPPILSLVLD